MKMTSKLARKAESGIALITVLLLLTLLSAIAVALVYKVNHEQHLQGADSGNTVAYYGAEAGMEKMMADLSLLYTQKAAPTNCDIIALQATPPNAAAVGTTYREYIYNVPPPPGGGCAAPPTNVQTISSGANAGLQAQIVRMNLQVTADSPAGDEARLIRNVEIAEIPVFQFGVFSQSDLSYFPGPDFNFAGRVQTNGNLFLAEGGGAKLTFHSPIRACGRCGARSAREWREHARARAHGTGADSDGAERMRRRPAGLPQFAGEPERRQLDWRADGGVCARRNGRGESESGTRFRSTTYAGNILSGTTGAKALTLDFVQGDTGPIEIIRRPAPAEDPTSLTGESRLYNQAQIRVLLSDDPNELPGGAGDPQNIRLANLQTNGGAPDYTNGVPVVGVGKSFFAEGVRTADTTGGSTTYRVGPGGETNWNTLPTTPPAGKATLVPATAPLLTPTTTTVGGTTTTVQPWNLLDGYLRVEIRNGGGAYTAVTAEWLQLGFARGANALLNGAPNPVHPNAILILQQQADRNGDGTASVAELVTDGGTGSTITGPATRNNWYPINMYETREGEFRENQRVTTNCSIGGVLNLVEIDVHNLQRWLTGTIGASGPNTEYTSQNGYVLYLSDRRGTIVANALLAYKNGEYGFEDVINPGIGFGCSGWRAECRRGRQWKRSAGQCGEGFHGAWIRSGAAGHVAECDGELLGGGAAELGFGAAARRAIGEWIARKFAGAAGQQPGRIHAGERAAGVCAGKLQRECGGLWRSARGGGGDGRYGDAAFEQLDGLEQFQESGVGGGARGGDELLSAGDCVGEKY